MDSRTRLGRFLQFARARAVPALAALGIVSSALAAQDRPFPLTKAIPDDVFMVAGARHNPERQFLEDHWSEVWVAFQESGVADDVFDMVLTLAGEDQRENLMRIRDRFSGLIREVDWGALGEGEMVFGERLSLRMRPSGQPVFVAPQDVVALFRMRPETARRNFEGMRALLEALVEEVNEAAGMRLEVDRAPRAGLEFATLDFAQTEPDFPEIAVSVGLHDDVLILTFGGTIRDEVAGLLAGTIEHRAISETPRFRAAFASLPQAEDGFAYFDPRSLQADLDQFASGIFDLVKSEMTRSSPSDRILNADKVEKAVALHQESNAAYFAGNYAEALRLVEQAYAADPTDPTLMYNQACFLALLGESERAFPWLQKAVDSGFYAPRQISVDPDLASLRSDRRYEAALESAREAAHAERLGYVAAAHSVAERLLGCLRAIDYVAVVYTTERYDAYSDSIAVLAADASSNPIHAVLTAGKPVSDFSRYLPAETVSFTVGGGMDLDAVYSFAEETVSETGAIGERILASWRGFQAQHEFDFRHDVLGWIDGETVSVVFDDDGVSSWVWMLRVNDDEEARKKLEFALDFLPRQITELGSRAPMLAMFSMQSSPAAHEELQGFHDVRFALMPVPMVCGVRDGWLILGSSGDAVMVTQRTAAGEHPSVLANEELMARALLPDAPASWIRFRDHSGDAETAAAVLGGVAAAGGMAAAAIPEPEAQQAVLQLCDILRKLAPVALKIDFYESSAGYQTFDGKAWRGRSVTHYVAPGAGGN